MQSFRTSAPHSLRISVGAKSEEQPGCRNGAVARGPAQPRRPTVAGLRRGRSRRHPRPAHTTRPVLHPGGPRDQRGDSRSPAESRRTQFGCSRGLDCPRKTASREQRLGLDWTPRIGSLGEALAGQIRRHKQSSCPADAGAGVAVGSIRS